MLALTVALVGKSKYIYIYFSNFLSLYLFEKLLEPLENSFKKKEKKSLLIFISFSKSTDQPW